MKHLETVKFNEDVVEVIDNFVSVKKLCENIGIKDFQGQQSKIKADESFQSEFKEIEINGIIQKVLCIPYSKVNGWLFSISVNRVKPEVKAKLIEYKNECFDVLYRHFNKSNSSNKNLPYIYQLERENTELRRAINRLSLESYSKEFKKLQDENKHIKRTLTQIHNNYHKFILKSQEVEVVKKELKQMTNRFQLIADIENSGKNLNTCTTAGHIYWNLDELDFQIKRDAKLIIETLCKNAISMLDESVDTSVMLARREI